MGGGASSYASGELFLRVVKGAPGIYEFKSSLKCFLNVWTVEEFLRIKIPLCSGGAWLKDWLSPITEGLGRGY